MTGPVFCRILSVLQKAQVSPNPTVNDSDLHSDEPAGFFVF